MSPPSHPTNGDVLAWKGQPLATPPILVVPVWDTVADGSRPFHVYCDAGIDEFGAALEQEQLDGSMKPIAYISQATLDSEKHWTPLDWRPAASFGLSNASELAVQRCGSGF